MRRETLLIALALVGTAALLAGCGGDSATQFPLASSLAADGSAAAATLSPSAADVGPTAVTPPALIVKLNSTLNGSGTVKATAFTSAELLSTAGAVLANATVAGTTATFSLTGLTTGHRFIRVNGLGTNLVPTKLDNVTTLNTTQFVGQTLRQTVIGSLTAPKYKMQTYSLGQTQHAMVNYSNGSNCSPVAYAYAMLYMKTIPQKFEVRSLGKAALMATYSGGSYHALATWAMGVTNHGKSSQTTCAGCHGTLTAKAATYAAITTFSGQCFKCHYGPTGQAAGMVNPKH